MKKLLALLLAMAMVLSLAACFGPVTDPTEPTVAPTEPPVNPGELVFTGSPTLEGNAADRLPVKEDVFVSQYDANGAQLEIGTYGGTIDVQSGGGS